MNLNRKKNISKVFNQKLTTRGTSMKAPSWFINDCEYSPCRIKKRSTE